MNSIELKARAKINLSLDVIRKRPDGYHDVKMIMQTIELHDRVTLEIIGRGIEVVCSNEEIPPGEENIAYRAAKLLIDKCGIKSGVKITIDKRIPVAAGLAGGSTDAAAVLKGMNKLFSLGIDETNLMAVGKQLGADVPYCIKGGTMLAEGIGDILTGLPPLHDINIVLVKPKIGVPTVWVYKNLNLDKISRRPDTDALIAAVKGKDTVALAKNMKNVLETVTMEKYGIIKEIQEKLIELGASGSMMSGSGPSVFGIFPDNKSAQHAYDAIKDDRWECFLTKTMF